MVERVVIGWKCYEELGPIHASRSALEGLGISDVDGELKRIEEHNEKYYEEHKEHIAAWDKMWGGYYDQHAICPICKKRSFRVTLLGYSNPPDLNRVTCSCGWVGKRDDMIPWEK
jgi:hypothetical protein